MKKVYLTIWTIALIIFCSYMKIHASEIYDGYTWINNYYSDEAKTNQRASEGLFSYFEATSATSYNANYTSNFNYFNSVNLTSYKGGTVQFEYDLELPQVYTTETSTIYANDYCNRWDWGTIDSYNNVIRWNCTRVDQGQNSQVNDKEYIFPKYNIKAYIMVGSGNLAHPCEVNQNTNRIICPVPEAYANDIHGLRIDSRVYYNSSTTTTYRFKFGKEMIRYKNLDTIINDSINQQTQQQQQQYEQSTNGTWTPNNNINTNQNGANETIEWGQQEEALLDSLDMNTTMLSDITISPTASAFIWDIVGGLRNMNPAIVMVMTSILGLGIAKMLLNR